MERRALIAMAISALVLLLWYGFVAPPTPPQTLQTKATHESSAAPTQVAVEKETQTEKGRADAKAEIKGEDATAVILEGSGIRVVVEPRGARISSVVLADYKNDVGAQMELVGIQGKSPLTMGKDGPWNNEVYKVKRTDRGVWLEWSDGKGNWVEKKIEVAESRFALDVDVVCGGKACEGGVAISCGVGVAADRRKGSFAISDAVARRAGKTEKLEPKKLTEESRIPGNIEFAGVEDQYFLVAFLPEGEIRETRTRKVQAKDEDIAEVSVVGAGGRVKGVLFAGAKELKTLSSFNRRLDDTVSFGIFSFLSVGFLAALRWIFTWASNWGLAIVLLTGAIRVVLFPLNHKSAVAMRKMQILQPKLKLIQDRYKERAKKDSQVRNRMNQEVMQVYKQEGVNPMGGCLPTLVQLPILFALYSLFANAIELRQSPFMFWITDLSLKDPYYVTPVLMVATMFLQQLMTPSVGDPSQRRMMMILPVVFGLYFFSAPAGLVLYWLINNVLTIFQQHMTNKMLGAPVLTK